MPWPRLSIAAVGLTDILFEGCNLIFFLRKGKKKEKLSNQTHKHSIAQETTNMFTH